MFKTFFSILSSFIPEMTPYVLILLLINLPFLNSLQFFNLLLLLLQVLPRTSCFSYFYPSPVCHNMCTKFWNNICSCSLNLFQASVYQTLHGVPNPYDCEIGERRVLGTSGQPIDDIARY
jgi:hypothetical protein